MDDRENLNNEKMIEKLRGMTDDIQAPPSLEPQAVEEMLKAKKKEKRRRYRWRYLGTAAAACICLALGVTAAVRLNDGAGKAADMADSAEGAGTENGTSAQADAEADAQPGAGTQTEDKLDHAEDYDEIYEYIQAAAKEKEYLSKGAVMESADEASSMDTGSADSAAAGGSGYAGASASSSPADGASGYSDTNVREEGVGEADSVKTDGKNLYIVSNRAVTIVGIETEEMEELARIETGDDTSIGEVYVEDGRLVILYTRYSYNDALDGYDGTYTGSTEHTCADTYDVSDPASPEKLGSLTQSGMYHTMRAKDGYIYLISDFYVDVAVPRSGVDGYIPWVQGEKLDAADIYMPPEKMGNSYTVISAFSLKEPDQKTDSKAVFGQNGMCYVSQENIYITEAYYGDDDADVTRTAVRKVAYAGGTLWGVAQTKVDGTLNDSFSIDEYDGYLRMVTTVSPVSGSGGWFDGFFDGTDDEAQTDTNSLYVLDEEFNIVGEIDNLAEDESVYSARFMGDIGYFVTFEQVDPLFSVDLSDPESPKVIGELKIPGFSEYLHPYGEGKLLGIGMAVDEQGVTTEGVKISMFDVSDPSDVTEQDKYVLENMYSTDVAYNYKAAFVDVEKNLFGFVARGDTSEYVIFTYDEDKGFQEVFSRDLGWEFYGEMRGLYSGGRFYLVTGNTVESYTMDGFEKIDDIVL